MKYLLTIPLLIFTLSTNAEVTLDGTLGNSGALPGPDYLIGADLGQQHGGNLFHSFKEFNLQSFESATFSGPDSVNIVFSRVTGGNLSNIDGLIRSTIPNAEMFLLNPAGIVFGENARLDVQGGFHASTADYMRLGEAGRFDASHPEQSILTVAPPTAFGFLDAPTGIEVQGSDLAIAPNADFSLIGGNLTINNAKLTSYGGRFNLVSVAQDGEVTSKNGRLDVRVPDTSTFERQGRIEMNNSFVYTSGVTAGGGVSIRGGQLFMHNSTIEANTLGDQFGKDIDIILTDSFNMVGDSTVTEDSKIPEISANSIGSGDAGHIFITVPRLEVISSFISSGSTGTGSAGRIDIKANQITIKDGGNISTNNRNGSAGGGVINIKSASLSLSGQFIGTRVNKSVLFKNQISTISSSTRGVGHAGNVMIETDLLKVDGAIIRTYTRGEGNAGEINIRANTANISGGAIIVGTTRGKGHGGNINIEITDTLSIVGKRTSLPFQAGDIILQNNPTTIASSTRKNGQAGVISISAPIIILDKDAIIQAASSGSGSAGTIKINAKELRITNGGQISSSNGELRNDKVFIGTGEGGSVFVQTDNLTLHNRSSISASSLDSGNAGNITIQAKTINVTEGSSINSSTQNAGGGNITLTIPNLVYLQEGEMTTSVQGGTGDGGNITIENPTFVVMDKGKIIAQADEGHGGNIYIKSGQFITSPDTLVSASSRLGLDGEIKIDSPVMDMDGFLVVLPGGLLDASHLMKTPCNQRNVENRSRFVVKPSEGIRNSPGDLLPGGPLLGN